jgi:hypothetical protein
MGIEILLG